MENALPGGKYNKRCHLAEASDGAFCVALSEMFNSVQSTLLLEYEKLSTKMGGDACDI